MHVIHAGFEMKRTELLNYLQLLSKRKIIKIETVAESRKRKSREIEENEKNKILKNSKNESSNIFDKILSGIISKERRFTSSQSRLRSIRKTLVRYGDEITEMIKSGNANENEHLKLSKLLFLLNEAKDECKNEKYLTRLKLKVEDLKSQQVSSSSSQTSVIPEKKPKLEIESSSKINQNDFEDLKKFKIKLQQNCIETSRRILESDRKKSENRKILESDLRFLNSIRHIGE